MAASMKPPLIIIRGNDICYLGIVRSCYEANIPCVVVKFSWPGSGPWYSEFSKYQPESITIDNPFTHADSAAKQLSLAFEGLYKKWRQKLLVLPSSDTNYMFVLDHYEQFADYILLMGSRDFQSPRNDVIHKASCAELLMASAPEIVPMTYSCNMSLAQFLVHWP